MPPKGTVTNFTIETKNVTEKPLEKSEHVKVIANEHFIQVYEVTHRGHKWIAVVGGGSGGIAIANSL